MALDREQIAVALFERLKAKVTVAKYFTRRDVDSTKLPMELHPVFIFRSAGEDLGQDPARQPTVTLQYVVKVFARNTNPEGSPDTQLNEIVRQVEVALERADTEAPNPNAPWHTTLGGLVYHCWLTGPVEFYQGETGDEAGAMLHIEALAVATNRG